MKAENAELQQQPQGSQNDLQTVQHNYATVCGKVIILEKDIKATKDKLYEATEREVAFREAAVQKAKQRVVDKFKESEEYSASQNYDAQYEDEYDKGVEKIFFNIWRKRHEIDYRFLVKEYQKLMADQVEQEKKGELDTRPPLSPEYFEDQCKIIGQEPAGDANNKASEA